MLFWVMLGGGGWLTAAVCFAAGWTARKRMNDATTSLVPAEPRTRGRLRHGGVRPRSSIVRCRYLRRGMRSVRSMRIHDHSALQSTMPTR